MGIVYGYLIFNVDPLTSNQQFYIKSRKRVVKNWQSFYASHCVHCCTKFKLWRYFCVFDLWWITFNEFIRILGLENEKNKIKQERSLLSGQEATQDEGAGGRQSCHCRQLQSSKRGFVGSWGMEHLPSSGLDPQDLRMKTKHFSL